MNDLNQKPGYTLEMRVEIGDKLISLNNKKFKLLRYIDEYGSIRKASERTGIPYRTALKNIEIMENELEGPIVSTKRGGKGGGGGSKLTDAGKQILWEYIKINTVLKKHIDVNEIEGIISDIDEENKIMNVNIDEKEVVLPITKNLNVGDSILLLISPEDISIMLEPYESSVRNLLEGVIIGMELQNEMVRLTIMLDDIKVFADITEYSREKLDLALGKKIFIGFKATSMAVVKI